jgi:hypothetical protein
MFGDRDLWPFPCSECGFVHHEEIGILKATDHVRCPRCGSDLAYYSESFQNYLRSAKETFKCMAQDVLRPRWNYLTQRTIPVDSEYARAAITGAQQTIRQAARSSVFTRKRKAARY